MSMLRILRAALLCPLIAIVACDGAVLPPRASSDVYEFRLQSDHLYVFHWPTGKDIRVFVNPGPDSARTRMLATAFERGAAQWDAHALFGEYHLTRAATLADADVILRYSNEFTPVNTEGCPPSFSNAVTTLCIADLSAAQLHLASFDPLPPADTTAGNIKMIVTILASQATIAGQVDRLVVHELGHVLGIGQHSPDPQDLMAAGVPLVTAPGRRDIATVQVLYHTTPDILP
jgi:hypothetical protein